MSKPKASKHLYNVAADKVASVSKTANNIASKAIDAANNVNDTIAQVRGFSAEAANSAGNTVNGAVNSIRAKMGEQKQIDLNEYEKIRQAAIDAIDAKTPLSLLMQLGDSPYKLTCTSVRKIKNILPIPREQTVLWADAEFDLRPSGIAITNTKICSLRCRKTSTTT